MKRKHHYVPILHLSGFTEDGTNESTLWVFDMKTGKQWKANPKNVAFQKDLYKVDLPETDPNAVENVFAHLESNVAPIIRKICETREMPSGDDYNWLMNYIALLDVRTLTRRETFSSLMEDVAKTLLKTAFASEENYKAVLNRMLKEGYEAPPENVTYEELRNFVEEERYTVNFDNNTHINHLLHAMDAVLYPLGERNWTVVYSPNSLGDFICSDHPVNLHWIENKDRGIYSSPGHGLLGTEVTVPLSSRILLLGRFENYMPKTIVLDHKLKLAILNSYSGMNCMRFIFSRTNDFIWYTREGKIGTVDDMRRLII